MSQVVESYAVQVRLPGHSGKGMGQNARVNWPAVSQRLWPSVSKMWTLPEVLSQSCISRLVSGYYVLNVRQGWVEDINSALSVAKKSMRLRSASRNIGAHFVNLLEQNEASIEVPVAVKPGYSDIKGVDVTITIIPNIYKKLEGIAAEEGRSIDELVRESIAGWIRNR